MHQIDDYYYFFKKSFRPSSFTWVQIMGSDQLRTGQAISKNDKSHYSHIKPFVKQIIGDYIPHNTNPKRPNKTLVFKGFLSSYKNTKEKQLEC